MFMITLKVEPPKKEESQYAVMATEDPEKRQMSFYRQVRNMI